MATTTRTRAPGHDIQVGQILVERGIIDEAQLLEALAFQKENGVRLGQAVVDLGFATEVGISEALRRQGRTLFVNLTPAIVDPAVAQLLSEDRCREAGFMAVNQVAGVTTVAMEDPSNIIVIDDLALRLGTEILAVAAGAGQIAQCLDAAYGRTASRGDGRLEELVANQGLDSADFEEISTIDEEADHEHDDQPVIQLVQGILVDAFHTQASDIHFEPQNERLFVRFRHDGCLHERLSLPKNLCRPVIARLKVMADLDIAQKRLPQDGRVNAMIEGRSVDFRLATTPTLRGEAAVIRILDGGRKVASLAKLGLNERQEKDVRRMIASRDGFIVATGPTGSGKTTSLYALLKELNTPDRKIVTIEDPVENQLQEALQINTHAKAGLTFAKGLRASLRLDPDVILVGEIRDFETAQIAVQAAMTGHLVLSTLHTVGAAESVSRLQDMGIDRYLLGDTMRGIISQRLVRRICPQCITEVEIDDAMGESLGLKAGEGPFYRGRGCDKCHQSGYSGRLALYEIMVVTPEVASMMTRGSSTDELRDACIELGMTTLRQDGIAKALKKQTCLREVLAVATR